MKAEIINELEALGAHYFRPVRSPDEHTRWLSDYLTDLDGFSPGEVRAACARWRQSGAKKFPTSGELLSAAHAVKPKPTSNQNEGPWREPSEAEYRALSIRDKIRHHRIMAHECGMKAGPMWNNTRGGRLKLAEMSDAWREWTDRAGWHRDEAAKLIELLSKQPA